MFGPWTPVIFWLTATICLAQSCNNSCPVCPDNSLAVCQGGKWVCPCTDAQPCPSAICTASGTWDASPCSNTCDWCPGFPPNCDSAFCDCDNCVWDCGIPPSPILIDVAGNGFELTDARHGVGFDFFSN